MKENAPSPIDVIVEGIKTVSILVKDLKKFAINDVGVPLTSTWFKVIPVAPVPPAVAEVPPYKYLKNLLFTGKES
jgi:hypothetical protein